MNATEVAKLVTQARQLPDSAHQKSLIRQLEAWGPRIQEPLLTLKNAFGTERQGDGFGPATSPPFGGGQPAETPWFGPTTATSPPAQEPAQPQIASEADCIGRLSRGDAGPSDILVDTYGWERLSITRKLMILLPRDGTKDFFVIPVEAEFVMGAFDEIISTILFDHTPGQLRYTCEKACEVERTGFALERLKDSDYWRTRRLTRGTLVH